METVQTKVRRPRCRVSPGHFRRLIERSSPVVEPADPGNSPLAQWARTTADGAVLPQPSSRLFRSGAIEAPPRSVLVIRTDEAGDLALTLPLLTALRSAWPQARITLLARGSRGEIMRGGGLVDEVLTWPGEKPWAGSLSHQFRCWRLGRELLHHSRPSRGRFDLAILPQRDAEAFGARYVACTAALRVVGFDPAGRVGRLGEPDERDLLTDPVEAGDPRAHALRHTERLASAMGITITPDAYDAPGLALIGPADRAGARSLLSPLAASPGPLIAVQLGPSQSAVSPAASINAVHARLPVRLALIGETGDRRAADDFVRTLDPSIPLVSAIGRAHPRTVLALLADSDLYLGGTGDAMQLASSVATPCVVGSEPADRARPAGPWSAGSLVVGPGGGVDQVTQAVLEVLTGSGPEPSRPSAIGDPAGTLADRRVRLPA